MAGDGDHGTTMLRVVERLEATAAADTPENLKSRLREVGWSIMGVDGGASSALLGTFFAGMADAEIGDSSMNCMDVAKAFEAGLRAISRQTKAQPGDKTMMDALQPAVSAFSAAAALGKTIRQALKDAALAARSGADSTKDLVARYGRAKFLGEKTRGLRMRAPPPSRFFSTVFAQDSQLKGKVDHGRPRRCAGRKKLLSRQTATKLQFSDSKAAMRWTGG